MKISGRLIKSKRPKLGKRKYVCPSASADIAGKRKPQSKWMKQEIARKHLTLSLSSKKARPKSPADDQYSVSSSSSGKATLSNGPGRLSSSSLLHVRAAFGPLEKIKEEPEKEEEVDDDDDDDEEEEEQEDEFIKEMPGFSGHSGNLRALKRGSSNKKAVFSLRFGRLTEGEHVAAGWPAWLSAVAGEAIDGWLPMRSDKFKRLEKEKKKKKKKKNSAL